MIEHAFHFLPSKAKAIVLLPIAIPLVIMTLIMIPGCITGAIYVKDTMIIDLIILGLPFLIVGGGLMLLCVAVLVKKHRLTMVGLLLGIVAMPATLAFLALPIEQLTPGSPAPFPQEAKLMGQVLAFLCGPMVAEIGVWLVLLQRRRNTRAERAPLWDGTA